MLSGPRAELADRLFKIGAIQVGEFELKHHESDPSAPKAPVKFNLRVPPKGPMTPPDIRRLAELMAGLAQERGLSYDRIAGIPACGQTIAEAFADIVGHRDRLVRMHKRESLSSGRRWITGPIEPSITYGERCLLIDDVIGRSRTKYEAFTLFVKRGAKITDILVGIDRQQAGAKQMADIGVRVHAIWPARVLLAHGVRQAAITESVAEIYDNYLRAEGVLP